MELQIKPIIFDSTLKQTEIMAITLNFGKYKGLKIDQLYKVDKQYLIWLACNSWLVRKDAQNAFLDGYKNEYCGKLNAKLINGAFDSDLNYDACFDVNGKKIFIKLHSKNDLSENFEIYAEMPNQLIFNNRYNKSGKWEKAIFNELSPIIKFKKIN